MRHHIRWLHSLVLTIPLLFVGCVLSAPPSMERVSKAQQLVQLATLQLRRGELAEAQATFTLSLETAPSAAALDGLGCVAVRAENLNEAAKYFIRAIEFDGSYARALANLAFVYEQKGRPAEARGAYQHALALQPDDPYVRNNFALHLNDQGYSESALFELRKAEAILPDGVIQTNIATIKEQP